MSCTCLFELRSECIATVVCIVMKHGLIDINIDTQRMTLTEILQNHEQTYATRFNRESDRSSPTHDLRIVCCRGGYKQRAEYFLTWWVVQS
jgi:hypothetical protein